MELDDDFDALDPERLIQCPYNKYHQIRACRFPYHLVKCRKQSCISGGGAAALSSICTRHFCLGCKSGPCVSQNQSYPEVAKELATCPFNARHLVPQADLSDHIKKCNDKGFIEQDIVNESSGSQREQMNAVSTWQAPPCDEDWETESLEQSDPPFIWGMTSSGINRKRPDHTFEASNLNPSHVGARCFEPFGNEESSVNSTIRIMPNR